MAISIESAKAGHYISYVNAGGRGTRLAPIVENGNLETVSKALVECPAIYIHGHLGVEAPERPLALIDFQILKILAESKSDVIVAAGDCEDVTEYVDYWYGQDSRIKIVSTPSDAGQLGTGGDLIMAMNTNPEIFGQSDHVLISNVDTVVEVKKRKLLQRHIGKGSIATIALTMLRGVPNEDAFVVSSDTHDVLSSREFSDSPVEQLSIDAERTYKASSTGIVMLDLEFVSEFQPIPGEQVSIYRDMLAKAFEMNRLAAYNNKQRYFKDIGTVEAWNEVSNVAPHVVEVNQGQSIA